MFVCCYCCCSSYCLLLLLSFFLLLWLLLSFFVSVFLLSFFLVVFLFCLSCHIFPYCYCYVYLADFSWILSFMSCHFRFDWWFLHSKFSCPCCLFFSFCLFCLFFFIFFGFFSLVSLFGFVLSCSFSVSFYFCCCFVRSCSCWFFSFRLLFGHVLFFASGCFCHYLFSFGSTKFLEPWFGHNSGGPT